MQFFGGMTSPHTTEPASPEEQGKVGYAIAWLLGVPIPILLAVWLVSKAC